MCMCILTSILSPNSINIKTVQLNYLFITPLPPTFSFSHPLYLGFLHESSFAKVIFFLFNLFFFSTLSTACAMNCTVSFDVSSWFERCPPFPLPCPQPRLFPWPPRPVGCIHFGTCIKSSKVTHRPSVLPSFFISSSGKVIETFHTKIYLYSKETVLCTTTN